MWNNRNRNESIVDFLYALCLGLAFFHVIIGLDKLNPLYHAWLLVQGSDYSYHYLAWEYFKDTPWHWPLGRLDGFAYPMYNSIMYTDSIPVFALFFKCFRSFLSDDFQYFGIWHASCYILNTYFGILLLKQIGWSQYMRWIIVPFFTGATVLVARFGHPALCAHWVLLWALYIYLKRNQWSIRKVYWQLGILIFLTSWIHPYLMFMVLGLCASVLFQFKYEKVITWARMWIGILCMLILIYAGWYSCGAFLFEGKLSEGLGEFSANLNTFVNAWDVGKLGISFQYLGPGQGEGIGYLGLGILLLVAFIIAQWIRSRYILNNSELGYSGARSRNWFFIACMIFFVFALSPKWTLGHYLIIDWHYNDYISRTFRGTGRFIWPLYYLILYWVFDRLYRSKLRLNNTFFVIAGALAIQCIDMSPLWKRKPYIDEAGNHLPYIDQISHLFSIADKVIAYPPYHGTTADFGDYIFLADMAQRYHKPISTGYSARYPIEIGDAFKDSLADYRSYFKKYPRDILISSVDSLVYDKKLVEEVGGQSFQFERYRVFVPDALISGINPGIIDSSNLRFIHHQAAMPFKDFLALHREHYVFGAIQQEGLAHMKEESKAYLRAMGSKIDSLKFGSSWVFALFQNKFIIDHFSNIKSVADSLLLRCSKDTVRVQLYSGAFLANDENKSSVQLNGREYTMGKRGINMIVTDSCGNILDRLNADTYLSDQILYR